MIFAGDGNDVVNGGAGADFLRGGKGQDTFAFDVNFGRDRIRDFNQADDLLDLRSTDVTAFEQLKIAIKGGATVVDTGTGTIVLQGFKGTLTTDDFLF
jgi:Ca2+-binding RTX toxin-like protein